MKLRKNNILMLTLKKIKNVFWDSNLELSTLCWTWRGVQLYFEVMKQTQLSQENINC